MQRSLGITEAQLEPLEHQRQYDAKAYEGHREVPAYFFRDPVK